MIYSSPSQHPRHVLHLLRIISRPAAPALGASARGSAFSRATTSFRQARFSCPAVFTPANSNASVDRLVIASSAGGRVIPAPVECRRQALICLAADSWLRIRRTASATTSRRASSKSGNCASQACASASNARISRFRRQAGMVRSAAARHMPSSTSETVTESARNCIGQMHGTARMNAVPTTGVGNPTNKAGQHFGLHAGQIVSQQVCR